MINIYVFFKEQEISELLFFFSKERKMSIQNEEKRKMKKVFALDFVSNEIKRLCMYSIFFLLVFFMEKDDRTQTNKKVYSLF
jgi:hypothetical protein